MIEGSGAGSWQSTASALPLPVHAGEDELPQVQVPDTLVSTHLPTGPVHCESAVQSQPVCPGLQASVAFEHA